MAHDGLIEAQALVTAVGNELPLEHGGGVTRLVSAGQADLPGKAIRSLWPRKHVSCEEQARLEAVAPCTFDIRSAGRTAGCRR